MIKNQKYLRKAGLILIAILIVSIVMAIISVEEKKTDQGQITKEKMEVASLQAPKNNQESVTEEKYVESSKEAEMQEQNEAEPNNIRNSHMHDWKAVYQEEDHGYYETKEVCLICNTDVSGTTASHMEKHINDGTLDYIVKTSTTEEKEWVPKIVKVDKGYYETQSREVKYAYCNGCKGIIIDDCSKYTTKQKDDMIDEHIYSHWDPENPTALIPGWTYSYKWIEEESWVCNIVEEDQGYYKTVEKETKSSICKICEKDITGNESDHLNSFVCAVEESSPKWVEDIVEDLKGYKCKTCGLWKE